MWVVFHMAPTPESILGSINQAGDLWLARVDTLSGQGFRPFSEDPGIPVLMDIAHGLAFTYRSSGHQDRAVTIAEHSVLASALASILWPGRKDVAVAALFHDACEAYLHDMQYPIRHLIQVKVGDTWISWEENDHRLNRHIGGFFGIHPDTFNDPHVHAVDKLAASFEKRDCERGTKDWCVPEIPPEVGHLRMTFQPPFGAKDLFLRRAKALGVF